MKSLVVFYSRFGSTAHIAYKLLDALREAGEANIFELSYRSGRRSLLAELLYRIIPVRVELSDATPLDVKDYDILAIGMPVWSGRPAPPVSAYIKGCENTDGKKVLCFLVYGIGESSDRCLRYAKKILDKKGALKIIDLSIPWDKVHDDEFVKKCIRETIKRLFLPQQG